MCIISQWKTIFQTKIANLTCFIYIFRDSLLASLLDGVRAAGNKDVHVTMVPTDRGLRLGPLSIPVDEEAESLHLKLLMNPPPTKSFSQCLKRFNTNIPYSGLLYSVTQEVSFYYYSLLFFR